MRARLGLVVAVAMIFLGAAGSAYACNEPRLLLGTDSAGPGGTVPFKVIDAEEGASYRLSIRGSTVAGGTAPGTPGFSSQFTMPDLGSTQSVRVDLVVTHEGVSYPSDATMQFVAPPAAEQKPPTEQPAPPAAQQKPSGNGQQKAEENRESGGQGGAPEQGAAGQVPAVATPAAAAPAVTATPSAATTTGSTSRSDRAAGSRTADGRAGQTRSSTAVELRTGEAAVESTVPARATAGVLPVMKDDGGVSDSVGLGLVTLMMAGLLFAGTLYLRRLGGSGTAGRPVATTPLPHLPLLQEALIEAELQEMIAEARAAELVTADPHDAESPAPDSSGPETRTSIDT